MTFFPSGIGMYDCVRLTGTCCSCADDSEPGRLEGVTGRVADISRDGCVKVWPDDRTLGGGKLWFAFEDIEKIELTEKYE